MESPVQDLPSSWPFESVTVDLFHVSGKAFLLLTDEFSGWPLIAPCGHKVLAKVVVRLLKDCFIDKGIPVKLFLDSGPQFKPKVFKEFSTRIFHEVSSP